MSDCRAYGTGIVGMTISMQGFDDSDSPSVQHPCDSHHVLNDRVSIDTAFMEFDCLTDLSVPDRVSWTMHLVEAHLLTAFTDDPGKNMRFSQISFNKRAQASSFLCIIAFQAAALLAREPAESAP